MQYIVLNFTSLISVYSQLLPEDRARYEDEIGAVPSWERWSPNATRECNECRWNCRHGEFAISCHQKLKCLESPITLN